MPDSHPFELILPTEADWERIRDIRIRSIIDTPLAFLEDLDVAEGQPEEEWRMRGRRNTLPDSLYAAARTPDGLWVGTMAAFISQGAPTYRVGEASVGNRRSNLVGVWVDPEWRGPTGPVDGLLKAVEEWTTAQGLDHLYLHVHEENERARRYYQKRGFESTGEHVTDPRDDTQLELEMVKSLR
ncbi:GNAT family N-acetyltransferase [Glaciibacter superstes]|uniref:GNAT family N-acetyltransferase n=1 Tax=Glaciibacter superstes TaxID=501023 RepID=UPI0003B33B9F|nr:GNAT family N-acetyltransferase [Glaciibacter superstes]